jgi:hypothetical protein
LQCLSSQCGAACLEAGLQGASAATKLACPLRKRQRPTSSWPCPLGHALLLTGCPAVPTSTHTDLLTKFHSDPPTAAALHCRSDGRIGTNVVASLGKMFGLSVDPWVKALKGTQFASADRQELIGLFKYLEFCLTQIVQDNELGALREVGAFCPLSA